MRRFPIIVIGTHCIFAGLARAQTAPLPPGIPLTTATVSVAITYDSASDVFAYAYSLSNSPQSVGRIGSFNVDISTMPNGASLRSDGLVNSSTGYQGFGGATKLADQVTNATIPVGFLSQPLGWSSGPTALLAASWYAPVSPSAPITPGQSGGPFVLTSHGVPGIRRYIAKPVYNPRKFFSQGIDDVSVDEAQQIVDLDKAIRQAISSVGYTVGPVQPPSLTEIGQLLDFLAALKHQAASLGWIYGPGSDGIVQSLDAKLTAAKASAASGDDKTSINQLNAFINELQAQHGKHLNDNAYYMLLPDAQFVISKLGAQ